MAGIPVGSLDLHFRQIVVEAPVFANLSIQRCAARSTRRDVPAGALTGGRRTPALNRVSALPDQDSLLTGQPGPPAELPGELGGVDTLVVTGLGRVLKRDARPIGPLPASSTAVTGVGTAIKPRAADTTPQTTSRHWNMLRLAVTV